MLEKDFNEVYTKFKLHFYRAVFGRFKRREATLTTVETFCMEIILALGEPTVNEFSNFVGISPPNAAYKINSLVQKGYVESGSPRRISGSTTWWRPRSIWIITTSAIIISTLS